MNDGNISSQTILADASLIDVVLVFVDPVLFPYAQPYGLAIIQTHLGRRGISSEILLPFQSASPINRLKQQLARIAPRIIGLSFRNLDSAGFAHDEPPFEFTGQLEAIVATALESAPKALQVLGGSGFSIDPYRLLRQTGVSIGFVGPAEADFVEFVERYLRHPDAAASDLRPLTVGLKSCVLNPESLNANQEKIRPRNLLPKSLPSAHVPYVLDQQALEYARLSGAQFPVRTKTGCSLRCAYCVIPFIEQLSLRPVQDVIADLVSLEKAGYGDSIFISDGEFNLPDPERAIELCQAITARFANRLRWRCYVCPSIVPAELPSVMKRAGCYAVGAAVDSLDDSVRQRLGKKCSAEQAMKAIRRFLNEGIETDFTLLIGAPEETLETVRTSVQSALVLVNEGAHVSVSVGLRIYPFTPLASLAERPVYAPYVRHNKQGLPNMFCSPLPVRELFPIVHELFKGAPRVHWTTPVMGAHTQSFNELAAIHDLHYHGETAKAMERIAKEADRVDRDPHFKLLAAKLHRDVGEIDEALDIVNLKRSK